MLYPVWFWYCPTSKCCIKVNEAQNVTMFTIIAKSCEKDRKGQSQCNYPTAQKAMDTCPRFPRILQSHRIADLCNSSPLLFDGTSQALKTAYISHSRPAILPRILPSGAVSWPIFLHLQRLLRGKFVANTKCSSHFMALMLNSF